VQAFVEDFLPGRSDGGGVVLVFMRLQAKHGAVLVVDQPASIGALPWPLPEPSAARSPGGPD
jgi:hypothetical protein